MNNIFMPEEVDPLPRDAVAINRADFDFIKEAINGAYQAGTHGALNRAVNLVRQKMDNMEVSFVSDITPSIKQLKELFNAIAEKPGINDVSFYGLDRDIEHRRKLGKLG